ncbi:30S ribosomal protein S7 [Oceanotoga sp. DSM 15011]|jgi:small subunit ribosomal protein S7|uniref:Small ribosomal subunit protein uS7 n=1 Tax=Oceanotoga teriensis TaxID=515440 RepID=A0AA45HI84_9BACT|nr:MULTISPECIES: 30S ribosomal protein S7 [Oceanotoga]MDN5343359.1 small subunit ribosomal protein [Oceanotoga sp.]MDO7975652.1 30S ribosomal protein S7 [Oceanotoga teriensis]PWJ90599.1 SSU ribosomal protein S7P [Oceanotoga teriensis]UYO99844.1 30S ribosomal protein S7 [Oceanotoga sp. DSM 15011]
MRRRRAEKRAIAPDPVYNDILVSKLVNRIMVDGKKSKAQKIVYESLERLAEKTGEKPVDAFHKALGNVRPVVEVRSRRIGGATYQVPFEVPERKAISLALRWIVTAARSKQGKPMVDRLSQELLDAFNETGIAVKKRDDTHKMAEANKAFAHYRW